MTAAATLQTWYPPFIPAVPQGGFHDGGFNRTLPIAIYNALPGKSREQTRVYPLLPPSARIGPLDYFSI
ncbi:hypothetical protein AA0481_1368 [Acetobacter orientalis NRIC 0481]|uniref:Uncharacterized protein n=1 Tax=Acetobacter orientalis TaxID=146474 RepID=A0A0D6NK33_9PROT|nr:hypothetical protein Abor_014_150 [Acetobacter orientalis]GBR17463.1 hypothetical protein AA0481_1368 [Acetobacter orientalis NRIC 0481]GEL60342.1 hypothetical protein AOR02nite_01840 [Acetobacter orientalis]